MPHYTLFILVALLSFPALAQTIAEDKKAVRIITYYAIGSEDFPAINVTSSQFKAHLKALNKGGHHVVSLPDVIVAYDKGAPLPQKSVILSFDGSHKSVLTHAAPLLKKYGYPFTVFLSPERLRANDPRYLNIKDIKRLQKLQLVTFGLHPENYNEPEFHDTALIRHHLNNAIAFYREAFEKQPEYLAFPNGLYSTESLKVIQKYRFKALFGEQSGVAYEFKKNDVIPRFLMTENYADMNRFQMVINAMPLPASEIIPGVSVLEVNNPMIGFTVKDNISLEKLACYASGQKKPAIETLGNRVEIRLKSIIDEPRFRVNCTLPVVADNEPIAWRWLGFLLNPKNRL